MGFGGEGGGGEKGQGWHAASPARQTGGRNHVFPAKGLGGRGGGDGLQRPLPAIRSTKPGDVMSSVSVSIGWLA